MFSIFLLQERLWKGAMRATAYNKRWGATASLYFMTFLKLAGGSVPVISQVAICAIAGALCTP
jgi:hypothetical protein